MTTPSLQDIRDALNGPAKNTNTGGLNRYFPFWKMEPDTSCTIRFLPDLNKDNPLGFLVEKRMHKLEVNGKKYNVPCNYMHGESCPICAASKAYYDSGDEAMGKKYWRDLTYVAQVLVVDSSLPVTPSDPDVTGQVKLVQINFSLFKVIRDAFGAGDLEDKPYEYGKGTDFVIKKDMQGQYASYVLSRFARRERALSPDEIELAESNIVQLSTVLPPKYDSAVLESLLEASINNTEFDESLLRRDGAQRTAAVPTNTEAKPTKVDEQSAPEPEAQVAPERSVASESASGGAAADAQAILESLRQRRNTNA